MYGIAPKLPITINFDGGLANTETIAENTQQNLKHLLLTCPGERIMDPDFGVGLRNFLFENQTNFYKSSLESRIHEQVSNYMPFVNIQELSLDDSESNLMSVHMRYSIDGVSSDEILFLSLKTNL